MIWLILTCLARVNEGLTWNFLVWQAKILQDSEVNYNYCVYDSDIATGYGVGAFLFLMASQVLIMVASRCFCCGQALKPTGSRAWAILLFVTCWYVLNKSCQNNIENETLSICLNMCSSHFLSFCRRKQKIS